VIEIVAEDGSSPGRRERLQDAIDDFNVRVTGRADWAPVAFYLVDGERRLRGGIAGDVWAGWLHVKVLYVDESLRRQGHGARLLRAAEDRARALGCHGVFLDSFTFQAAAWYPRFGYQEFGRLEDYPHGHAQVYFRKSLATKGGT
jgi:GNAT superfamily N-acetyltransferase